MTALLVIATILILVGIDFGQIKYRAYKMHKAGAIWEPSIGAWCMADGKRVDDK